MSYSIVEYQTTEIFKWKNFDWPDTKCVRKHIVVMKNVKVRPLEKKHEV